MLFLADTQIGVGTVSLADQRAVLRRIVDLALEREVDCVIHGGDVFEGPIVTPEHLRCFLDATAPLRERGVPVLLLRGNGRHDMAVRTVHALDVLSDVPGFTVCDHPMVLTQAGAIFCVLPWVHPGRVLAEMNGSIDHDNVNAAIVMLLLKVAKDLHKQAMKIADKRTPVVFVAHWAITGAALPGGMLADELREPVLPWADLDQIGFDLIVGAHIHQPQMLSRKDIDLGPGFVIGSPQQLNFGETGDHGCWIVDWEGKASDSQFVPIPSREFVTLEIDAEDPMAALEGYDFDREFSAGSLVRARLVLTEEQFHRLNQAAVRNRLLELGAERVRFDFDIAREARRRVEVSEQLPPVEAMRLYCDANGVDDPLRGELLRTIGEWSSE